MEIYLSNKKLDKKGLPKMCIGLDKMHLNINISSFK